MTVNVALINPKFVHNIGGAVRAMSCYGTGSVVWTGSRIDLGNRLPREERMKDYQHVEWEHVGDKPIDLFPDCVPVAVELVQGAEPLHTFEHPENALYVFGPEDGSLPKGIRTACHRFVVIPSNHCLNLAAAIYIVLYDRAVKRWREGAEDMPALNEERGWWHSPAIEFPDEENQRYPLGTGR